MTRTFPSGPRPANRLLRTGAITMAAALLLSACGSSDSEGVDSSSSAASSAVSQASETPTTLAELTTTEDPEVVKIEEVEAESAFPVTIANRLGDVVIESAPVRIVALGQNDVDVLVGLGIVPVGAAAHFATGGLAPWLEDYSAEGIEFLTVGAELPLEQIAALNPDVILASPLATIDANYDILNEIAPVVADTEGVLTDSWQDRTTKIGVALGVEVDELIAKGEADLAEIAATYPGLDGKTYTLAWAQSADQIAVMAADDVTSQMFAELGLTIPESVTELVTNTSGAAGTGAAAISLETMENLDADLMIVAFGGEELRETFESNALFTAVPAVADGRYLAIGVPVVASFRVPTALSLGWTFGQLADLFEVVGQ